MNRTRFVSHRKNRSLVWGNAAEPYAQRENLISFLLLYFSSGAPGDISHIKSIICSVWFDHITRFWRSSMGHWLKRFSPHIIYLALFFDVLPIGTAPRHTQRHKIAFFSPPKSTICLGILCDIQVIHDRTSPKMLHSTDPIWHHSMEEIVVSQFRRELNSGFHRCSKENCTQNEIPLTRESHHCLHTRMQYVHSLNHPGSNALVWWERRWTNRSKQCGEKQIN